MYKIISFSSLWVLWVVLNLGLQVWSGSLRVLCSVLAILRSVLFWVKMNKVVPEIR